jgi:23S rRNA (uridine2552-2'-O)-methyltransferase
VSRSAGSQRWLKEHRDDHYVKLARSAGYRSRAAFKLEEMDRRDRLFRSGMNVVDLGAAPGGWSQYAAARVGPGGRVLALDVLPMEPVSGVSFVQGDFREAGVLDALLDQVGPTQVQLVLSDMSPNISGMNAVDQPRAIYLAELALELARRVMAPGGSLLVKVFQGEGSDAYLAQLRRHFRSVAIRKPRASRPRSREFYALARGYGV